jgi:hypothetical protein
MASFAERVKANYEGWPQWAIGLYVGAILGVTPCPSLTSRLDVVAGLLLAL